ncbi:hypothetical protein AIGOOFII_0865 [Methylobacterium marchantiae]|nr:hypothetical protein AIGOOFII_0865 [Methylobacterium marchantiae]
MATRREFTTGAAAGAAAGLIAGANRALAAESSPEGLAAHFAQIEQASGGRLGIGLLDTATGVTTAHRGGERFPMCSTFKVLAAGAALARIDRGEDGLDRRLTYEPREVVPYSPMTGPRAGGEVTLPPGLSSF